MAEPPGTSEPAVKPEEANEPFVFTNTADDPVEVLTDNEEDDTLAPLRKRSPPERQAASASTAVDSPAPAENAPVPSAQLQADVMAKLQARQKAMADRFRASNGNVAAPDPFWGEDPAPSPAADKTPAPEAAEDEFLVRYNAATKEYTRKKKANELDSHDEINHIRAEAEYQAYVRKKALDDAYDKSDDEESGLFVSERATTCAPSFAVNDLEEDETPASKPKRGRKRKDPNANPDEAPTKKPRKAAAKKNTKVPNYSEDQMDDMLARARTKKDDKAKKVGRPKGSKAQKKQTEPNMLNEKSLFGGDVFRDTAATAHLASQPLHGGQTQRKHALNAMLASVPEDSKGMASRDTKYLDQALRDLTGRGSVVPSGDGNWLMKGMRTSLKPYQILGVAFMRKKEGSGQAPHGGILADEMGLGKTIMMLANIINGKSENPKCKTTLIVASPALVAQWFQEIRTHCLSKREHKHGIGKVIQHRAGHRVHSNDDIGMLEDADVVLTTYNEVMKSYPKPNPPSSLVTAEQKEEHWKQQWEKQRGVLHAIRWHRVVLDEASAIKNHLSHTSKACRALEFRFAWAISGTPIQNSVMEFYPYFQFLKHPGAGSYKLFKENYHQSPDDSVGNTRLNILLRGFMIRRTHLDRWMGTKLVDLPQPHENTLWLEFNDVERQIYEIVRKRFISRINRVAQDDETTQKVKFSSIWVMLIRLRQLTASVLLVFDSCLPLLEREDYEKLNAITTNENQMNGEGEALLVHLRHVLRASHETKNIEGGLTDAAVLTSNEVSATNVADIGQVTDDNIGGKHGTTYRIRKYLAKFKESSAWEEVKERARCCGCRSEPLMPYVTSCSHIFCLQCLQDLQHSAARRGMDMARCTECGETYTEAHPCEEGFVSNEERPTSMSTNDQTSTGTSKRKKKNEPEIDWLGLQGEILPSAKSIALKAQILEWLEEDPSVKILIYTQWIPMVKILGRICDTEQWKYLSYTGKMSHDSRNRAIEEFTEKPECQILLASLKCGGLGLNIIAASKVILIDPWWNNAIEQQAFCRVFRIGQQKSTTMLRLVVKNTVDEAMMAIKERKKIEIDEVMERKAHDEMSLVDLMRLFGELGEDADGRPFIMAEDVGNAGRPRVGVDPEDEENVELGNEA